MQAQGITASWKKIDFQPSVSSAIFGQEWLAAGAKKKIKCCNFWNKKSNESLVACKNKFTVQGRMEAAN